VVVPTVRPPLDRHRPPQTRLHERLVLALLGEPNPPPDRPLAAHLPRAEAVTDAARPHDRPPVLRGRRHHLPPVTPTPRPHLTAEQIKQVDYWYWRLAGHDQETCGLPDDPLERWLVLALAIAHDAR
jgi:hypothetical protein